MAWTQRLAAIAELVLSIVVVEEDVLEYRGDGLLGLDSERYKFLF
jgi:hypothetical protein